ncbi:MAG: type IV pilus assembly protein PilM [Limnospira sp. PMC 1290.21]|uniref:type IV pilus assembly protein PilM n=1 Tax=unclassified Limnospira TaxID=2642885 RepID=UPI0028E151E6|nr:MULTISPECIES: type IV pilus assembly protein PilM [unclassified Limnospira]MDT9299210.1 type IV pilus assembly protein PilM [Limnospira sp. PMC 1281.21]MDT9319420.1 type IV pilus assembly protein PilM [Limnospira sp. PMC 1290.21]
MVGFLKGIFSSRKPGMGIELAAERINIVEIRKKGDKFKLLTLATAEVPENVVQDGQIVDTPTMSELIESTLADNNIKTKNIATAIPGREAVTRLIPVPAELNEEELKEYMNAEAGLYLPFPREEADVDYQKLGTFVDEDGIEKVQVLLVATRKEVTNTYIETFEQAGLQIEVLEISNFALIRTMKSQLEHFSSNEAAILADIEFDSTELVIVVNGVPQFTRTIPIGLYQVQSGLNNAMNLPPSRDFQELQAMTLPVTDTMGALNEPNPGVNAIIKVLAELADELRRSIDFYINQNDGLEIAQLLLAGPGAAIGQLDEFFMQRLAMPATQVDPIEALNLLTDDQEIPPEQRASLGVVLGLGLRVT